jgi:DNA-directed RNA polymerase subunit alpha
MNKMIHPFEKPSFPIAKESEDATFGRFVIEPLERGFGLTIGNALRRVLLSAIPGASVYAVKIDGALHEFTALDGVSEDVTMIILNLKKLILEIDANDEDSRELTVECHGPCTVYAKDIQLPSDVKVINGDLEIAHLAEGGHLKMSLYACNGRGYVTCDENRVIKDISSNHSGLIATDSNYSPIVKVNYSVDATRVGHDSRYDKLTLEVTTNGSIAPSSVIAMAAEMLIVYFSKFIDLNETVKNLDAFKEKEVEPQNKYADMDICELELSVRSGNALKRQGYTKVYQLTQISEEEMMKFRNLGKKSLKEIEDRLSELGLSFKKSN